MGIKYRYPPAAAGGPPANTDGNRNAAAMLQTGHGYGINVNYRGVSAFLQNDFRMGSDKGGHQSRKTCVAFEEAASAFEDERSAIFADLKHSAAEERKILVGSSRAKRMLMVAFTDRKPAIRIISARKANFGEKRRHEAYQKSRTAASE